MKKLFLYVFLGLLFSTKVYSFDYGYDIWDNYSGGAFSYFGAFIIILLILYNAFFGKRDTKYVIWAWILFFATFGVVLSLFKDAGFLEAMIALGAGFAVQMSIFYLNALAENKEYADWVQKNKYLTKKKKKRKRKRRK